MTIRFAKPNDAQQVALLMYQAMEEIVCKLIGRSDIDEAILFLKNLFEQPNNQYSYQNAIVIEENAQILGSLVFYNGADLQFFRSPVLELAYQKYGNQINIEDETQAGETYIDTLSVHPKAQGRGIGSRLISYLLEYIKEKELPPAGLLVDVNNPNAERLYTRLGFEFQNEQNLTGGVYKHLVYKGK
ncbi:MAG: GNAT family N-acetyltransferase [Bacteroidota bacterium]|nr:GNAT family N-acetyltransferase [Bacteroidota bacterium]